MTLLTKQVWIEIACVFGRHLVALALTGSVLYVGLYVVVEKLYSRPTAATAKVVLETLTLELAETEGDLSQPAAQPQVDATVPPPPLPLMETSVLSDALSDFRLPEPPPMEVPKLPDLPTLQPELPLPKVKQTLHHLPEITLPPLEPLTPIQVATQERLPAEKPQVSKGATARVEKKTKLVTDLSNLMKRYPPEALANRWEGTVVLRLTIDDEGELEEVEVHQSSGYRVLDREAIRMMNRAEFIGGPDVILQSVEFKLNKHANVKD